MSEYDNTNSGYAYPVEERESDRHPHFKGKLNVEGTEYWLSSWKGKDKGGNNYLSIRLTKIEDQREKATVGSSGDDEIDF